MANEKLEHENKKYIRRQYYVKDFQLKFVLRFCMLIIAGSIIMGGIIYFFTQNTLTTAFENSRLTIKSTADFILPTLLMSTAVMVVLISLVSLFVIVLFSHRIAGPIFRFEKYFDKLKEGYISDQIYIRTTDEIKELADKCNEMTKELSKHIDLVKTETVRLGLLEDGFNKIVEENKKVSKEQLDGIKLELTDIRTKFEEKLSFFKTR
ncbi:methyl-accepting chemotaxis protein [bacterium]|nr:methyl-accepting chemotaxis protein [bacterium]